MLEELKQVVLEANLLLPRHGLVDLTLGNVSGFDRRSGLVVIKPSGIPYEDMTEDDLVVVDLEGRVVDGRRKPSSDTKTHVELYRAFPNVRGAVHTHSEYALSWALAGRDIPCYGSSHADFFYGDIPCLRSLSKSEIRGDYERSIGRMIASEYRRQGLDPDELPGCLITSIGPYAWGKDPLDAVYNAIALENCARTAYRCELINPEVAPASRELQARHFLRRHGENAYYGQD